MQCVYCRISVGVDRLVCKVIVVGVNCFVASSTPRLFLLTDTSSLLSLTTSQTVTSLLLYRLHGIISHHLRSQCNPFSTDKYPLSQKNNGTLPTTDLINHQLSDRVSLIRTLSRHFQLSRVSFIQGFEPLILPVRTLPSSYLSTTSISLIAGDASSRSSDHSESPILL